MTVQLQLPIENGHPAEDVVAGGWARTCPLCGERIRRSGYLASAFKDDPYGEWAANLVTHYRHEHIAYYDRALHSAAYARVARYTTYDEWKAGVNNRAKRQVLRGVLKASLPSRDKYGLIEGFRRLEHNDAETNALITVLLSRRRR